MPTWRCPHCGTPQTETARCWVCRRSSTACGTCRHFRRSVAAQLGYCGLDRGRTPLAGDEIRACWEGWAAATAATTDQLPAMGRPATPGERTDRLEFVEVGRTPPVEAKPATAPQAATGRGAPTSPSGPQSAEPGWNLWGDLEI